MTSAKSFNDARVLSTTEVTLNKRQLKMLLSNLEQGDHSTNDLLKLQAIAVKFGEALDIYGSELDRLNTELNDAAREYGVQSQEIRAVSIALNNLVKDQGPDLVGDVIISTTEWDWIKTRWGSNTKLVGVEPVRSDLLAINEAITNARGVKFTKDKQAWIQGDPEPEESNQPRALYEAAN